MDNLNLFSGIEKLEGRYKLSISWKTFTYCHSIVMTAMSVWHDS